MTFEDRSFFHASEHTIIVLITATPGTLIVILVVCNALFAFFHLDISIEMELMTGVTLGLARMTIRGQ
jgi:hypothetical protein